MLEETVFDQEVSALSAYFERRRRKYLLFFYIAIGAAILLAASAVFIPGQVMTLISRLFFVTRPVTRADITAYRIFTACLCLLLVVRPVHFYRHVRYTPLLHAGQSTDFSLKDAAYARLFRLFGPYDFAPRTSIPLDSVRQSLTCGAHPLYSARDCISGQSHHVGARLCDVRMLHPSGSAQPGFQGILMALDLSSSQVKLRSPFKGRLIIAPAGMAEAMPGRPKRRIPLPAAFSSTYAAYASEASEAMRFLNAPLLEALQDFCEAAARCAPPAWRIDDKVEDAFGAAVAYGKEKLVSLFGKAELPAERTYNAAMRAVGSASGGGFMAENSFALEYYGTACIAFIPCKRGLIESKSLFEPVMSEESAKILYAAMRCVDRLSAHLETVMP